MVPNKAKEGEKAGYKKSAWFDERKKGAPGTGMDEEGRLFAMIFISVANYSGETAGAWRS